MKKENDKCPEKYQGLKVLEAREKVVEDLKSRVYWKKLKNISIKFPNAIDATPLLN